MAILGETNKGRGKIVVIPHLLEVVEDLQKLPSACSIINKIDNPAFKFGGILVYQKDDPEVKLRGFGYVQIGDKRYTGSITNSEITAVRIDYGKLTVSDGHIYIGDNLMENTEIDGDRIIIKLSHYTVDLSLEPGDSCFIKTQDGKVFLPFKLSDKADARPLIPGFDFPIASTMGHCMSQRGACYIRISAEEISIEMQIGDCRRIDKNKFWPLLDSKNLYNELAALWESLPPSKI